MSFLLIAFLAIGILLGLTSTAYLKVDRTQIQSALPTGALDGIQFVRFAGAMDQYAEENTGASGTISPLVVSGQFTSTFLSNVTAWLSPAGVYPRVLVCSGNLGAGALQSALQYSGGDAALGTPSKQGEDWTSAAAGSSAQALPTSVSSSATIVFVVDVQT